MPAHLDDPTGDLRPADLPAGEFDGPATVLDRVSTGAGTGTGAGAGELVLRRRGSHYEVISNGVFLMDTRDGRSERLLVRAALDAVSAPDAGLRVLIGGLGVGFSLRAALEQPRVGEVTVVEREPVLLGWHRTHLAAHSAGALDDPRVRVVVADLLDWIAAGTTRFDVICLDIDNGPDWTVDAGNARLYGNAGLAALGRRLEPAGVLAVWSAGASPAFEQRLREGFAAVEVHRVPVPRGEPDLVYLAAGRPDG